METARTWHICSFFVGRKHGPVIIQSYLWLWEWDNPQKSLTLTKKSLTHQKKVSLTKKKFDSQKKVWRTKTSLTHLRVKCEELSDSKLLHLQTIYWQKKIDKEYHVWLSSYFYFLFYMFPTCYWLCSRNSWALRKCRHRLTVEIKTELIVAKELWHKCSSNEYFENPVELLTLCGVERNLV